MSYQNANLQRSRLEESEKVENQARAIQRKAEFHAQDVESVVSQVLRWAEETGRPIAPTPIQQLASRFEQRSADNRKVGRRNCSPAPHRSCRRCTWPPRSCNPACRGDGETGRALSRGPGSPGSCVGPMNCRIRFMRNDEREPQAAASQAPRRRAAAGTRSSATVVAGHSRQAIGNCHRAAECESECPNGCTKHMHSLRTRFVRWLDADSLPPALDSEVPGDRRRSKRHPLPGLVAYYWTGGTPQAHQIGDISSTGFYLLTKSVGCLTP